MVRFNKNTRVTNVSFFGCCGEKNLSVRVMSPIFPRNFAQIHLLQRPERTFHFADIWSVSTKEIRIIKSNGTFRFCDIHIYGSEVDSLEGVRYLLFVISNFTKIEFSSLSIGLLFHLSYTIYFVTM